jgi:hypothetical protein
MYRDEYRSISGIFLCGRPDCDKVGTVLCSFCSGARYCDIAYQEMHWRDGHRVDCKELKKQRESI